MTADPRGNGSERASEILRSPGPFKARERPEMRSEAMNPCVAQLLVNKTTPAARVQGHSGVAKAVVALRGREEPNDTSKHSIVG